MEPDVEDLDEETRAVTGIVVGVAVATPLWGMILLFANNASAEKIVPYALWLFAGFVAAWLARVISPTNTPPNRTTLPRSDRLASLLK